MSLTKADINKQGWEEAEFPLVCEICLGENPYLRMSKNPFGAACKNCERPFTVFRWQPGSMMRYRETKFCQYCSKINSACQTCWLDLQYHIPIQERDKALNIESKAPKGDVNRQYHAQNEANKVDQDDKNEFNPEYTTPENRETLKSLARSKPYQKHNRPHTCSFFEKGECNRGKECPYRHDQPSSNTAAQRSIKNRPHHANQKKPNPLAPPEDKSITSLFIMGVTPEITEEDIRGSFSECGEIKSVILSHASKCAFVNFKSRMSAEVAAHQVETDGLSLQGHTLKVKWGKTSPKGDKKKGSMQPPAPPSLKASSASKKYPSQDPTSQGSVSQV